MFSRVLCLVKPQKEPNIKPRVRTDVGNSGEFPGSNTGASNNNGVSQNDDVIKNRSTRRVDKSEPSGRRASGLADVFGIKDKTQLYDDSTHLRRLPPPPTRFPSPPTAQLSDTFTNSTTPTISSHGITADTATKSTKSQLRCTSKFIEKNVVLSEEVNPYSSIADDDDDEGEDISEEEEKEEENVRSINTRSLTTDDIDVKITRSRSTTPDNEGSDEEVDQILHDDFLEFLPKPPPQSHDTGGNESDADTTSTSSTPLVQHKAVSHPLSSLLENESWMLPQLPKEDDPENGSDGCPTNQSTIPQDSKSTFRTGSTSYKENKHNKKNPLELKRLEFSIKNHHNVTSEVLLQPVIRALHDAAVSTQCTTSSHKLGIFEDTIDKALGMNNSTLLIDRCLSSDDDGCSDNNQEANKPLSQMLDQIVNSMIRQQQEIKILRSAFRNITLELLLVNKNGEGEQQNGNHSSSIRRKNTSQIQYSYHSYDIHPPSDEDEEDEQSKYDRSVLVVDVDDDEDDQLHSTDNEIDDENNDAFYENPEHTAPIIVRTPTTVTSESFAVASVDDDENPLIQRGNNGAPIVGGRAIIVSDDEDNDGDSEDEDDSQPDQTLSVMAFVVEDGDPVKDAASCFDVPTRVSIDEDDDKEEDLRCDRNESTLGKKEAEIVRWLEQKRNEKAQQANEPEIVRWLDRNAGEPDDYQDACEKLCAVIYNDDDEHDMDMILRRTTPRDLYYYLKQQYWYLAHVGALDDAAVQDYVNDLDVEQQKTKKDEHRNASKFSLDQMMETVFARSSPKLEEEDSSGRQEVVRKKKLSAVAEPVRAGIHVPKSEDSNEVSESVDETKVDLSYHSSPESPPSQNSSGINERMRAGEGGASKQPYSDCPKGNHQLPTASVNLDTAAFSGKERRQVNWEEVANTDRSQSPNPTERKPDSHTVDFTIHVANPLQRNDDDATSPELQNSEIEQASVDEQTSDAEQSKRSLDDLRQRIQTSLFNRQKRKKLKCKPSDGGGEDEVSQKDGGRGVASVEANTVEFLDGEILEKAASSAMQRYGNASNSGAVQTAIRQKVAIPAIDAKETDVMRFQSRKRRPTTDDSDDDRPERPRRTSNNHTPEDSGTGLQNSLPPMHQPVMFLRETMNLDGFMSI